MWFEDCTLHWRQSTQVRYAQAEAEFENFHDFLPEFSSNKFEKWLCEFIFKSFFTVLLNITKSAKSEELSSETGAQHVLNKIFKFGPLTFLTYVCIDSNA